MYRRRRRRKIYKRKSIIKRKSFWDFIIDLFMSAFIDEDKNYKKNKQEEQEEYLDSEDVISKEPKYYFNNYAFYKKKYFFSVPENNFFKVIQETLDLYYNWKYLIFPKARVWDLIDVKNKRNIVWINKIRAKHIDYTIVSADDFQPILCIELQDNSHLAEKRKNRDNFIEQAFMKAGLTILFIRPDDANQTHLIQVFSQTLWSPEKNFW